MVWDEKVYFLGGEEFHLETYCNGNWYVPRWKDRLPSLCFHDASNTLIPYVEQISKVYMNYI